MRCRAIGPIEHPLTWVSISSGNVDLPFASRHLVIVHLIEFRDAEVYWLPVVAKLRTFYADGPALILRKLGLVGEDAGNALASGQRDGLLLRPRPEPKLALALHWHPVGVSHVVTSSTLTTL